MGCSSPVGSSGGLKGPRRVRRCLWGHQEPAKGHCERVGQRGVRKGQVLQVGPVGLLLKLEELRRKTQLGCTLGGVQMETVGGRAPAPCVFPWEDAGGEGSGHH